MGTKFTPSAQIKKIYLIHFVCHIKMLIHADNLPDTAVKHRRKDVIHGPGLDIERMGDCDISLINISRICGK